MQPSNVYYGGGVQPEVSQSRPSPKRKLMFIVLGALLAVTVILGIVSAMTGKSTSKLGASVISQIAVGDVESSYSLLSDESKQVTSADDWKTFVETNKPLLADKKVEKIFTKEIDDGIVSEGYNVGEPGSIHRVTINLSSKSGQIESIKINKTAL